MRNKIKNLLSEENRWALIIAFVLIVMSIISVDDAPLWIYEGF